MLKELYDSIHRRLMRMTPCEHCTFHVCVTGLIIFIIYALIT